MIRILLAIHQYRIKKYIGKTIFFLLKKKKLSNILKRKLTKADMLL